jgi:hypothetical protein
MKNLKDIVLVYYPIIIAFIAMMYSIILGLTGDFESAQYSAHWPATILLFAIAIRQRRNNFYNKNN